MIRLLSILTLIISVNTFAADPFKTAKSAIKSKNGLENAEKSLTEYATNLQTPPTQRAKAFNMAAQVADRIREVENEKMYLKQQFDTVRYFNALLRVYQHTMSCDSVEAEPDERGRLRSSFGKDNRRRRQDAAANLLQGGKWMMKHGRYGEAFDMFDVYDRADSANKTVDSNNRRLPVWAAKCALLAGRMHGARHYATRAIAMRDEVAEMIGYKSQAELALGDTTAWLKTLGEGVEQFPANRSFFLALGGYYRKRGERNVALALTDRVLAACPDTIIYREARCQLLYEMGEWARCIEAGDFILGRNANNIAANFYTGASLVSRAEELAKAMPLDTKSENYRKERQEVQSTYQRARKALENFRRMRAEDVGLWAPLLYKVYYALNMGKELNEVEQYIK
ncbi:MAG: hypothetical protein HUK00_07605 [Bacteroidaceae bacterium]|nr:hypothetical protein [Bacteroidaceae bacterium]